MSDKLRCVLAEAGLDELYDRFLEEGIDTDTLAKLTPEEFSYLGVSRIGDQVRLKRAISAYVSKPSPNSGPFSWGPHLVAKDYEEEFELITTSSESAWDELMTSFPGMDVLDQRDDLIILRTSFWMEAAVVGFRRFFVAGKPRFAVRINCGRGWDLFGVAKYFAGKLFARLETEQNLQVVRTVPPPRIHPIAAVIASVVVAMGAIAVAVLLWNNFGPGARGKELAKEVCSCFSEIKDKQNDGEIPLGVGNVSDALNGCYQLMSENSRELANGGASSASSNDLKSFAEIVQKCTP